VLQCSIKNALPDEKHLPSSNGQPVGIGVADVVEIVEDETSEVVDIVEIVENETTEVVDVGVSEDDDISELLLEEDDKIAELDTEELLLSVLVSRLLLLNRSQFPNRG
jgi:hypothetical protein